MLLFCINNWKFFQTVKQSKYLSVIKKSWKFFLFSRTIKFLYWNNLIKYKKKVFMVKRKNKNDRGQAAMEFLMTYGWAILAAVISIGALAYFGVFSPGKMITGNAIVNAPFSISSWQVQAGTPGVVNLDIRNGLGENIGISKVSITNCGEDTTPVTINSGSNQVIPITCSGDLKDGDQFKGDIEITYRTSTGGFDKKSSGSIREIVRA